MVYRYSCYCCHYYPKRLVDGGVLAASRLDSRPAAAVYYY